jgi:non-specific protein-tyrosine kinase
MKNPAGSLLVTSALPNEGKTTTAANLAVILAQAHKQIILVDADLRHPSLHRVFGLSNKIGLTSMVLDENLSLTDVMQSTEIPGLRLLTSGPLPPNPSDVLSSPEVTRIIDRLRADADLVIFDSPPVLIASDATVLASKLIATMLVVSSGQTRMEQVARTADSLKKVNAKVVGVVVNKMHPKYATEQHKYLYYYPNSNRRSLLARWRKRSARKREVAGSAVSNPPN